MSMCRVLVLVLLISSSIHGAHSFSLPPLLAKPLALLQETDVARSIGDLFATFITTTTSSEDSSRKLETYQTEASEIASSFNPKPFKPVPWLSNCHVQTIASVFLRDIPECAYVNNVFESVGALLKMAMNNNNNESSKNNYWDKRERIETPDNDFFHADFKFCPSGESNGVAVILHGLESNSNSGLSRDIADAHLALGLDVVCLNFRGCSGTPNDTLGGYHLGYTDDLIYFLDRLSRDREKTPRIYLSGFSLGANVVVKALGEMKEQAIDKYNIQGATVLGLPFDGERNYKMLEKPGINKLAYTNSLLKTMKVRANTQLQMFCDGNEETESFDYKGAIQAKTIYDYEDAVIAKIYGFKDPIDYYQKCSSVYFMEDVAVPFLVLNSQDDPFFDSNYFPIEKSAEGGGRAPAKMVLCENGGHCGFLFSQLEKDQERPRNSWAASEMSRFVNHVMSSKNKEAIIR